MKTGRSHGRSSGATIRLCAGPSGKACPISLSPEPFAVNHLDRLGVGSKSSTSHAFTCTLNFPGTGRFCLSIPKRRTGPRAAAAYGAVVEDALEALAQARAGIVIRRPHRQDDIHESFCTLGSSCQAMVYRC